MLATHKVNDSHNNTVGFIVDKVFYTDYYVKQNISHIDNLSMIENGEIGAKQELPEVGYKEAIIKGEYTRLVKENSFSRDIQHDFRNWKKNWSSQILEVEGTRQIGKTTEICKFAYENYEFVIYVNMLQNSNFVDVIKKGCKPLEFEKYCIEEGLPHFVNSRSTVIIVDEIQSNTSVFNSLRVLRNNVECDIIITGSYLGRYFSNSTSGEINPFYSAGNIYYLQMNTLSFCEFCRVCKAEEILKNISVYGESEKKEYEILDDLYLIYRQIGGYPAVIKEYMRSNSLENCYFELEKLLITFKDESRAYFKNPRDVEIFDVVYKSALKEMCNERKGTGKNAVDTITEITNINMQKSLTMVSNQEIANAVMWLKYCGILGTCDLANNGEIRDIVYSRRMYFQDCGIASYLANKSAIDRSTLEGVITETFVFNELNRLFITSYTNNKVKESLCFSVIGNYELDFMLIDINNIIYGIEVKTNDGNPKSLKVFLDKRFINRGIVAKPTKGGRGDKFNTIPIYTVGCRFPYS